MRALSILLSFTLPLLVSAQFGSFFEQMFHGHGGHHQEQPKRNVPSDASWIKQNYESATCDGYLCPSLACVSVPAHCPCVHDLQEEKIELGTDGLAICATRRVKGKSREEMVEAMRKGWW